MVRITRENSRNTQKSKKQHKKKTQTQKIQQVSEIVDHDTPSHPPTVESHRFMSSVLFDGNTLITKSQKDNEPAIQRIYTKKQLAREIPIGKEMIDMYLDGEMPKELQRHDNRSRDKGVFRNVLISPADLGLLPPSMADRFNKKEHTHEFQTRRQRQRPRLRRGRQTRYGMRDRDGIQMVVDDYDDNHEATANRRKHIFDLP